jgi:hypothetical protein
MQLDVRFSTFDVLISRSFQEVRLDAVSGRP